MLGKRDSTHDKHTTNRKVASPARVIPLVAPFLLFLIACVFVSAVIIQNTLFKSLAWQTLVNEDKVVIDTEAVNRTMARYDSFTQSADGTIPRDEFPGIRWGEKWATLTFNTQLYGESGIKHEVFQGDADDILNNGVGHFFFSSFPGLGEKIVLSGHVMTDFYVIEEMQVGDTVTINASYGDYVYRVDDIVIFDVENPSVVVDLSEEEQLVLYTCYPRGYAYRPQRIALVCSKVSGADFR